MRPPKPKQLLNLRTRMNSGMHTLGGAMIVSKRGVPYIQSTITPKTFSICWFQKERKYRVFTPFPGDPQERHDFYSATDVIEFLERNLCQPQPK